MGANQQRRQIFDSRNYYKNLNFNVVLYVAPMRNIYKFMTKLGAWLNNLLFYGSLYYSA